MQNLRKSMKFFFWFLAAVFILFIFFDFGTTLTRRGDIEKGYIAKVGKKNITLQEFNELYQRSISNSRRQNMGPYEQKIISDDIINRLIINNLMNKFIKERNIKIDDKLAEKLILQLPPYEIVSDSSFYENGVFNQEKYLQILKDPRYSSFVVSYKMFFTEDLPTKIANTELLDLVRLTNSEVVQKILEDEVKVKVEYLYFPPSNFDTISVSDEEGREYFKENYSRYNDIKGILSYAFFPLNIYEEDKKNTREIAENIISQFNGGIQFDTLINYYSDSVFEYAKKDIKDFPSSEIEILKTMEKGEIKKIENENGIYIYYLKEKEKNVYGLQKIFLKFKPSYENANIVKNKIEDFIKDFKKDSISAISTYNVNFKRFYYRKYGDNPFKIENVFILRNSKRGEFFTEFKEDGFYLIKVEKNFYKEDLKYEDIKEIVNVDLKRKKCIEGNLNYVMNIRSKMKDKIEEFKKEGIYGITDYITLNTECPPFTRKGKIYGAIFNLSKGIISSPIVDDNGIFIIKVIDRKEPDVELIKSRFNDYYLKYYDKKRGMVLDEWYREIIDNGKIQDFRNNFTL